MIMRRLLGMVWVMAGCFLSLTGQGQTVLGKHPADKVTAAFLTQNSNAWTLAEGLLAPLEALGVGTGTGTNSFVVSGFTVTFTNGNPVNVIFEGDSLTQEWGTGTDNPHGTGINTNYSTYPQYLRRLWTNSIASWQSYAVGGNQLWNVTNRFATVLANLPSTNNNLMLLWIGANDFWAFDGHAITDTNIWLSTWRSYCTNVQAHGVKLVAFTVTDRYPTSDAARNAFRAGINNGIRLSPFWDALVDMDAANVDMNPTNNLRTYDGTHANTNGAIWQAKFIDRSVGFSSAVGAWFGWPPQGSVTVTGTNGSPTTNAAPAWTTDADYVSFASRASLTDATQEEAVGTLVLAAKAHGWWTSCDLIYPFVGGTSTACAQNLKGTNYTITFSGNVYYTNGITGDGTNGYGNTGWNAATAGGTFHMTNCHLFAYVGAVTTSPSFQEWLGVGDGAVTDFQEGIWMGTYNGSLEARINCMVGNGATAPYPGPVLATRTNDTTYGYASYFANESDHNAGTMTYFTMNDASIGSLINANVTVLARNRISGGIIDPYRGPLLGMSIGGAIVPSQWALMWQDWRAFQVALGRNP